MKYGGKNYADSEINGTECKGCGESYGMVMVMFVLWFVKRQNKHLWTSIHEPNCYSIELWYYNVKLSITFEFVIFYRINIDIPEIITNKNK